MGPAERCRVGFEARRDRAVGLTLQTTAESIRVSGQN
jgi:hypothetical protein